MQPIILYLTCSSKQEAISIIEKLFERNLIACANIIENVTSYFKWENKLQSSAEIIILAKTIDKRFNEITKLISTLHSYNLPAITAINLENCEKKFLKWIETSVFPDINNN